MNCQRREMKNPGRRDRLPGRALRGPLGIRRALRSFCRFHCPPHHRPPGERRTGRPGRRRGYSTACRTLYKPGGPRRRYDPAHEADSPAVFPDQIPDLVGGRHALPDVDADIDHLRHQGGAGVGVMDDELHAPAAVEAVYLLVGRQEKFVKDLRDRKADSRAPRHGDLSGRT